MKDYDVDIQVDVQGMDQITQIENRIKKLQSSPVKLSIDINTNSLDTISTQLQKSLSNSLTDFSNAGKDAAAAYIQGFSSGDSSSNVENPLLSGKKQLDKAFDFADDLFKKKGTYDKVKQTIRENYD